MKYTVIKLMSALIILAVTAMPVAAYGSEWIGRGEIDVTGQHQYKAVRLTSEIYNRSKSDLSDLLITDSDEKAVPYFINSCKTVSYGDTERMPMKFLDEFIKDSDTYTDFHIDSDDRRDTQATAIIIDSPASAFAKNIELSGSYDGINWSYITSRLIYRVDGNESLSVKFGKKLKYTYYRFRMINNAEGVAVSSAWLEYDRQRESTEYFTAEMEPTYSVNQDGSSTVVKIYGIKHMRITGIALDAEGQFQRSVRMAGSKSSVIYNLKFGSTEYKDTEIEYTGTNPQQEDVLSVFIDNGNDPPVDIKGLSVSYYADELIFDGRGGGRYNLLFGNESIEKPPVYDISGYSGFILDDGYDILSIENVTVKDDVKILTKWDYTLIFNIIIAVTAALLGFFITMRLMRKENKDSEKKDVF